MVKKKTKRENRLAQHQWLTVVGKGFLMGAADIIPGVSGGTIALIVGIYERLIGAIEQYDHQILKLLVTGRWKELRQRMQLGFLLPLVIGIGLAIFSMAGLLHYLLTYHQGLTWSYFFGLVGGSIWLLKERITFNKTTIISLLMGAIITFCLVGMIPVETSSSLFLYFVSGAIAICAMILPGISGAFILLLLGKYDQVMLLVKQPLVEGHFIRLLVFGLGMIVGILAFSKLIKWLLNHYYHPFMAFLAGMMIGSLRKIWPFGLLETGSWQFIASLGLIGLGAATIGVMRLSEKKRKAL